jgi:hypothetical protein
MQRTFSAVGLFVLLAMTAQAHPGHSMLDQGITHIIQSPYHILVLSFVGALFLAVSRFFNKPVVQRCFACAGTSCLLLGAVITFLG